MRDLSLGEGVTAGLLTTMLILMVIACASDVGYSNGHKDGMRQANSSAQIQLEAVRAVLAQ